MKAIPGYPGYSITDDGRVWSDLSGRWLKPFQNSPGYLIVRPCVDGRNVTRTVHSLVLLAFEGPRPADKPHIRHLDGNPANNTVGNLKYGTALENAQDRDRHGTTHRPIDPTHCFNGHPRIGSETGRTATGKPVCRICCREQAAARPPRRPAGGPPHPSAPPGPPTPPGGRQTAA